MTSSRREEARHLDADERKAVEHSRHPSIQRLSDGDLGRLLVQLRERRAKARDLAHQRRREIRGKGEPRGAAPARVDDGAQRKAALLAQAVSRLNSEKTRRKRMESRLTTADAARKALALKQAAAGAEHARFNTRDAFQGMRSIPNERAEEIVRPMERGRQIKAGAVAQARRDARG